MLTKEQYSCFFAECMKYLKISNFAYELDINQSCLSKFVKGGNGLKYLSIEDADKLYRSIRDFCKGIA